MASPNLADISSNRRKKMDQPIVHVGFPKAASTWIQQLLIPANRKLTQPIPRDVINELLVEPHPLQFEAQSVSKKIRPRWESELKRGKRPLITAERLTGNPHGGFYDQKLIADRIHEAIPNARIWIVLREQLGMIESIYKQYVSVGGVARPSTIIGMSNIRVPSFEPDGLMYDSLIDHYHQLFGEGNVAVSLFEDLKYNENLWKRSIADAVDCDLDSLNYPVDRQTNVSLSETGTYVLMLANRLFHRPRVHNFSLFGHIPGRGPIKRALKRIDSALNLKKLDSSLESKVEAKFSGRFEESNSRLATMINRDLGSLSYEIGHA